MNTIRAIVHTTIRGYRGNRAGSMSKGPKIRNTEMVQNHMALESLDAFGEDDGDDLDATESNFTNVGLSEKMHNREMSRAKEKLKRQIVGRKYFGVNEPATLTWGEKEQIRLLHSQDPKEWSVETLSDSFPASQEAIKKILSRKWSPKSTRVIENYEKKVIENWKLFKSGKLPINPNLKAHLEKFRDRRIKTMDPEDMKKYLKPKPVFPKPNSTKFTNIIQGYLEEKRTKEKEEMADEIKGKSSMKKQLALIGENHSRRSHVITKTHENFHEAMPLDQFIEKHVERLGKKKITPVDRVIVDEYKERKSEAYKTDTLLFVSQSPVGISAITEKSVEQNHEKDQNNSTLTNVRTKSQPKEKLQKIDENKIDTGIIARHKRDDAISDDFPEFIVIPRNKFKRGVTYRVDDKYYDDDGEFLYRVTGLKS